MKNQNNQHTLGNMPQRGSFSNGSDMRRQKVCKYENHTPTQWSSVKSNSTEANGSKTNRYGQNGYTPSNKVDNTLVCRTRSINGDVASTPSTSPSTSQNGELNISNRRTLGYQRSVGHKYSESVIDGSVSKTGCNSNFCVASNVDPKKSNKSNEPIIKMVYNLEIVTSESRPGDKFLLDAMLKEALIVHNEIIRRINNGADPFAIEICTLKEIYYFTQKGAIQHLMVHYLTDIQISYLLQEAQTLYKNLLLSRGIEARQMRLNYLSQIRFLNFRRIGQTHWIDYRKKQVRLLGMPVALNVKGLEVLGNLPDIKVGGMRLLRKDDGYGLSVQLFIPVKIIDEFNHQVIINSMSALRTEEKIENEEVEPEKMEETIDNELLEALQEKYNRNKKLDKHDNSVPRFLKGLPEEILGAEFAC